MGLRSFRLSCCHRWRSHASPVLTAIGLIYGNPVYLTPTESTSLNQWLKNLSQMITSTTSTAVQHLVKILHGGFWANRWNISQNVFIYTPFLRNTPTGQTARQIYTLNGSNDADSCKDLPYLALVDIAAHLGDQIAPKKTIFGAWIGIFQPNGINIEMFIL